MKKRNKRNTKRKKKNYALTYWCDSEGGIAGRGSRSGRPSPRSLEGRRSPEVARELGGAPRNLAPRNHLWVSIVKPSGCRCTGAFGGNEFRRDPTSPFSEVTSSSELPAAAGSFIGIFRGPLLGAPSL